MSEPMMLQLRRLKDQHRKLERELEHYGMYSAYSSSAKLKERELKKVKLKNKEMITTILSLQPELAADLAND
jgi:hypothetical protein